MKNSLYQKLQSLLDRYEEISFLLSDIEVINNQNYFRELSKEYAQIENIVKTFKTYQNININIEEAMEMLSDIDEDVVSLAKEELEISKNDKENISKELEILLLPKDPNDDANIFLEIRAGTGGDEAGIFVGDLLRMYLKFAEKQKWQTEILNSNESEKGGFKEVIVKIKGESVYSKLKFESGAHRVQRVPETESQGRVHTSACTVAIMPEVSEIDEIEINTKDLKIDTFRASGAGGQHINKTDSAIRITHLPTGTVIECQEERSQHKNKASALSMLKSKILQKEREEQKKEQSQNRRNLVGSGDRSEKIRTYNYPQSRITDHRINLTLYRLNEIMEGNLDYIIQPLIQEYQADLLLEMAENEK